MQILDIEGPFLAAPVVTDAWPDGLPALDQARMDALRASSALFDANPGARDGFVRHVLVDTLAWRHNLAWGPEAAAFAVAVPEHQTSVDITFVMQAQDDTGVVTPGAALLLGIVLPPKAATTGRAPAGSGTWTAGPADRLAHALRVRNVPLGLVTNGDSWTLVAVSDAGAVSTATWTRHAWLEEPQTLRAFVALLTRARFLGVAADQTLPALLTASLARQEEVTERLAEQSQAVVEMLVATLGRLDATHVAEHGARLLPDSVGPAEVYQASVTVLMRLVFLLYAEERGLLPLDDDTYGRAYAVTTLAESLRERATDHGEDALERTATGWYRLLSLFRGVHRGARHEQLILPAYGGSLFDPDRFPWLEGRSRADGPLAGTRVPAVDDRTLLRALDALQTLQFAKERRRVSYRSLDVEQIGYVYEGLLDQDAQPAEDWVVSIAVSDKDLRKNGPEVFLADLEAQHSKGDEALAAWLVEQIKAAGGNRSKASILKALTPPTGDDALRYARLVREACGNDDTAATRVMPYCRLLRMDPRDLPVVYPPGSLYLTDSLARANTGAVYTPRFLAEQVVETTLEALVYKPGPLDVEDKTAWVLRTPEEILDLKICDIAAGSGAFLVAATRYLADRLLEARRKHDLQAKGSEPDDEESVRLALGTRELEEQELLDARRAVIDHCIYGVDINPMAVEMAKLSLWLVTLDRSRPFSFLDDRLATGDSLLGITSPDQLRDLHFDPKKGRALHADTLDLITADTDSLLKAASELRKEIAETDLRDTRDAEHKQRLLHRSRELTMRLAMVADGLSGASLAGGTDAEYLTLTSLVSAVTQSPGSGFAALEQQNREWLTSTTTPSLRRRPAHYPLLFPEVFTDGRNGFDAIVGNPPFLGGHKLQNAVGANGRLHLLRTYNEGRPSKGCDLVVFFLLAAGRLLADQGCMGILAKDSLAFGDTRDVGLARLDALGLYWVAAGTARRWPTLGANISFVTVVLSRVRGAVAPLLDRERVERISPDLSKAASGQDLIAPEPLAGNRQGALLGAKTTGMGFVLDAESSLLSRLPSRELAQVKPFLSGRDILQNVVSRSSRLVIDVGEVSSEADLERRYPVIANFLRDAVLQERLKSSRPVLRQYWWRWEHRAENLFSQIAEAEGAIALARVGTYLEAVFVEPHVVPNEKVVVVPRSDNVMLAMLSSNVHFMWLDRFGGRRDERRVYDPRAVFDTFPFPQRVSRELQAAADEYVVAREAVVKGRGLALNPLLKLVHNPTEKSPDVTRLRAAKQEVDAGLMACIDPAFALPAPDFQDVSGLGIRYYYAPSVVEEVMSRLLRVNHARHAEEVVAGLHGKRGRKRESPSARPPGTGSGSMLFGDDS